MLKENLNFGDALNALKNGQRVSRKGWNGKNMYLYLQEGSVLHNECRNPILQKEIDSRENKSVNICPHIDMRAADGSIVIGWLASQTDMLSNDWCVLED